MSGRAAGSPRSPSSPAKSVPLENAADVGIDDEDGMISGVKRNRVGGFRCDAIQVQKLLAEFLGRLQKKFLQRALVMVVEKFDKCLEPRRFLAKII